jgi:hypothetical protein
VQQLAARQVAFFRSSEVPIMGRFVISSVVVLVMLCVTGEGQEKKDTPKPEPATKGDANKAKRSLRAVPTRTTLKSDSETAVSFA